MYLSVQAEAYDYYMTHVLPVLVTNRNAIGGYDAFNAYEYLVT